MSQLIASEFFWQLVSLLFFLTVGFVSGSLVERRHYRSIRKREAEYQDLIVVSSKTLPNWSQPPKTELVTGSVVISVDYFKRFIAALRKLFGGRLHTYESLIDRGRREALLRAQEAARKKGATMIFNLRLETSSISKGNGRAIGSVEVLAYGTAIIP